MASSLMRVQYSYRKIVDFVSPSNWFTSILTGTIYTKKTSKLKLASYIRLNKSPNDGQIGYQVCKTLILTVLSIVK